MKLIDRPEQAANLFFISNLGELYRILARLKMFSTKSQLLQSVINKYNNLIRDAQELWDKNNPGFVDRALNYIMSNVSQKTKKRKR